MKVFWIGVFGLVLSLVNPPCLSGERELKIVADKYPPYYSEDLPNGGFMTEIVAEAFKRVGYAVQVKFRPWKRALSEAKVGMHDGIYTLWYRQAREEWFVYSDPISPASETGFYRRKDKDISFERFEDLKPYTIGVGRGYVTPPGFDEASLKTSLATDDEQNLRKLQAGRIDLALTDKLVAKYVIYTKIPRAFSDLEWLPPALHIESNHLAISKKSDNYQTILTDFNRGLREIEADGTLKAIKARHGF